MRNVTLKEDFAVERWSWRRTQARGAGYGRLWPIQFWPIHFWLIHFGVVLLVICGCCCGVVCCGCVGVSVGVWLLLVWTLRTTTPDPRWTALPDHLRRIAQNFSFFPLPLPVSFFLCVFSLSFGCVFEGRNPQMCTFGLSGCRAKTPRLRSSRGFTRHTENSTREHLRVPARKWWRERKKARNFGPLTLQDPNPSGPHPWEAHPSPSPHRAPP